MRFENGEIKSITIRWDNVTFPLRAGTPVDEYGKRANDETAVGLVICTVSKRPDYPSPTTPGKIYVLVGGDVDLEEVKAESGVQIGTKAMNAMCGIRFHRADGTAHKYTYTLPKAESNKLGGIMVGTGLKAEGSAGKIGLAVATASSLGGVKAVEKTEDMTQPIGVDEDGMLFTIPGKGMENLFTGVVDQGGFDSDGLDAETSSYKVRSHNYIAVEAGKKYGIFTMAGSDASTVKVAVYYYDSNDYETAKLSATGFAVGENIVVTVPEGATYIRLTWQRGSGNVSISPSNISNVYIFELED